MNEDTVSVERDENSAIHINLQCMNTNINDPQRTQINARATRKWGSTGPNLYPQLEFSCGAVPGLHKLILYLYIMQSGYSARGEILEGDTGLDHPPLVYRCVFRVWRGHFFGCGAGH